jgi:hypothetical protein
MNDKHMRLIAGVFAICLANTTLASDNNLIEQSLAKAWRRASAVDYVTPDSSDVTTMRELFTRLLQGERDQKIESRLRQLGWNLLTQSAGGRTWTVLTEDEDNRSGRGLFAIASQGRHALQAPHVPSDGLTGEILLRYAADGLPRALAWNTLPRSKADMAHSDGTYFMAFSQAYATVFPDDKIIQIHGFDGSQRRTRSAEHSGAIVSATHKYPSRELRAAVDCLKQRLDPDTRLYGQDVSELGGTTNSIARTLRRDGYEGFIHVELSLPLREALRDEADKRLSLFECLGGR